MSNSNVIEYKQGQNYRLTLSDLARLFNLPVPTVRSYVKKGLPCEERGEMLYFDLRTAVEWYRSYSSQQLREYKSGRASEQNFLRELIEGQETLGKLIEIDQEFDQIYREIKELDDRFWGANERLLDAKGAVDPSKMELYGILDANRRRSLQARIKVLETRRSGLENMLRKKLPDLRSIDIGGGSGDDDVKASIAAWAEAARDT